MENLPDWAIPVAVLLLLIASQLFWLRRLIRLGERFTAGKWERAGLQAVVGAPCLFFFAYILIPSLHRENSGHASTTLTLRNILLDAPFWWWFVGSLIGSSLVLAYRTLESARRAAVWVYRRARKFSARGVTVSAPANGAVELLSPARRQFLEKTVAAASAVPFLAAGYGLVYGRLDIEITRLSVRLAHLPKPFEGFRIVHLSDFHISPFMSAEQIRRCVDTANGLRPDLVALTGDYVSDDPGAQEEVVRALAGLRAPYGVFGCMGNHEYMTHTEESITRLFAAKQIRILRQERTEVSKQGETLNLIGVDYQQKRFGPDHDGHLVEAYLEGSEKLVMPGTVNLMLNHNPNAFDRAAELGVGLMLSGHTHGGQVSLEFIHRGLSLAYMETPYVSGWYSKVGSQLYVNRGIGTTGPPIRFGERPEIAVLELTRQA